MSVYSPKPRSCTSAVSHIVLVSSPGIEPEPYECHSYIQTTKLAAHLVPTGRIELSVYTIPMYCTTTVLSGHNEDSNRFIAILKLFVEEGGRIELHSQ